jgi:transglutaminase-like putative cysteine protease
MDSELKAYLKSTPTIESEHPEIVAFAREKVGDARDPTDIAVRLYYAVRDGIRYNPYGAGVSVEGLKATTTLHSGEGWCVMKSILLAACLRSRGIPARLGYADVRNHLSTARMRERMKTDVFFWHGYNSIYLQERWVKATPAFNIELCEKFRIRPLDFDGSEDSLYHPFDLEGNRHMEYIRHRGEFADVPIDQIIATFEEHYAGIVEERPGGFASPGEADFDEDVEIETAE